MNDTPATTVPRRAETLQVLGLMGRHAPILMLTGDDDGYGTRWTIGGQQIQPGIARWLMAEGFITDTGATEFGARKLTLTPAGTRFRENGVRWWSSLNLLEKLKIIVLG